MSKPIFTDEMKHAVLSDMVNVFQKQFDTIDATLELPTGEDDESDLQRTLEAIAKLKTTQTKLLEALNTTVKGIMIFRNEPALKQLHKLRSSEGYGILQKAMDIGLEAIETTQTGGAA